MIDRYIIGNISRISPEAPVPVLNYKEEYERLGGAGNVINNIISLGANVRVLGNIGKDLNGSKLIELLKKVGADTKFLYQNKDYQTIVKTRFISQNQQLLRLDEETKTEPNEEFAKLVDTNLDIIFKDINAVVLSDYGKGAINKEIANIIIKYANKNNIPVIVDPKGTDYSKYKGATICTPNVKELETVLGKKVSCENDIKEYGKELQKLCKFKYLALTRSEKGITLFDSNNITTFPAYSQEVIDVTGAGDTVVATLSVLMASKCPLDLACKLANVAAGVVVKKFGTSTVTIDEIKDLIEDSNNNKIIKRDELKKLSEKLKQENKKISFTNGCFDLLHVGHIDSLKQSKAFGDVLIVAVNTDASVKRYKGDERPIISEEYRLMMLASLECVDYLVLMDDDNAANLVKDIKPDFYVKGADYKGIETPETKIVKSYGGVCKYINISNNVSTTKIIEKIRNLKDE